jgi:hydrogenase maturation factor HypE
VISLIVFGFAVALLIVHILDSRVPRGYVLAAFIASAVIAAGDVREHAGQTCTTTTTTATATTTNASGQPVATTQTYPVTTCTVYSTVNVEAVAALVASIAMALLVLAYEVLDRLGRAAGGWSV